MNNILFVCNCVYCGDVEGMEITGAGMGLGLNAAGMDGNRDGVKYMG